MSNPFTRSFRNDDAATAISLLSVFFNDLSMRLPKQHTQDCGANSELLEQVWNEAVLYSVIAKDVAQNDLPDQFDSRKCVFGDGTPTLESLMSAADDATVVHFPTDKSECIRMYVFRRKFSCVQDHRMFLTYSEQIPNNFTIFLINTTTLSPQHCQIDGNSWQLAFQLALKCLSEKSFRPVLAHAWLITGGYDQGLHCVNAVVLDGKVALFEKTKRNILLPYAGMNNIR